MLYGKMDFITIHVLNIENIHTEGGRGYSPPPLDFKPNLLQNAKGGGGEHPLPPSV